MQENAGHVNRGLDQKEIDKIPTKIWFKGKTKSDNCTICMSDYVNGDKFKALKNC